MGLRQWLLSVALAVCALVCAGSPGRALASTTQESILMDDDQLIYAIAEPRRAGALREMPPRRRSGQGVGRLVRWSRRTPTPTTGPSFDATDPAAYPPGAWARYDLIGPTPALG